MMQFTRIPVLLCIAATCADACTVFVLTDTNRVLFCNNEDSARSKTRIWFAPSGPKHYGCVFVGYDDGWAQGGMNTEGLACDWVAGWKEKWNPDARLPEVRGNQEVLETCATVEEAIAFYRGHRDPNFSYSKTLLTDRTGASVVIGAHDGKLQVERANQTCGIGYGVQALERMLAESSAPTVTNGVKILRACLQKGRCATKYSNVFDLRSGVIFLIPVPTKGDEVKFNLVGELRKGGHYYDMPRITRQLEETPRPLLANMERFPGERSKAISGVKDGIK
jgi:hypothetical protein